MEVVKQYCDIQVSTSKFEKELQTFDHLKTEWKLKGVVLVNSLFPVAEFMFLTAKLKPASLVFAVRVDFSNYDIEPPSLKFIDPFSGAMLQRKDIPINFWQMKYPAQINSQIPLELQVQKQDLLQGNADMVPFFCLRGIREYHDHPAHTGDQWLLYRGSGIGDLNYILDQLYNHSVAQINAHNISLTPTIGFNQIIALPNQQ